MSWHMTSVSPSEKKLGNVVKLFWKRAHVELLAPGQTSLLCLKLLFLKILKEVTGELEMDQNDRIHYFSPISNHD